MQLHKGRLIDHVHLIVEDLERSKIFYKKCLEALGLSLTMEADTYFIADELFVSSSPGDKSNVHIAFQAANELIVKRFYEAALAAGGTDNGAPGLRDYHPGYYAAYVLDPDGNNIEAVFHGATSRSAESVVFEFNG